jgi:hypothetical protein
MGGHFGKAFGERIEEAREEEEDDARRPDIVPDSVTSS